MKTSTKTYIALAIFALFILMPHKSEAAIFGIGKNNFCAKIPGIEEKIVSQVDSFQAKREKDKPLISSKLEEAWQADKTQIEADRADADARRALQIQALLENAKNDAEKKAMNDFATSVDKAISDLRMAVDKATEDYQSSVKDLRDERLAGIDELIADYKSKISTSFAEIQTKCGNSKEIEKTLRDEVDNLRITLKKNQEMYDSKIESIDTFEKTRQDAVVKAEATYTKSMKSAETALRKVVK